MRGLVRNGYSQEFAQRLYDQIKGFGEYGFPESHAASFALIVYVSAWLKRHHPAAFRRSRALSASVFRRCHTPRRTISRTMTGRFT